MSDTDASGVERVARAYDDTDDKLVAECYTVEAAATFEDQWWARVEWDGTEDTGVERRGSE